MNYKEAYEWLNQPGIKEGMPHDQHTQEALSKAMEALHKYAYTHEWNSANKRPTEEGEYFVYLEYDEYNNGNPTGRKTREIDIRHFGTCYSWKMDGEPDEGLVWEEQTGSAVGEYVLAWMKMPKEPDIDIPDDIVL
jgi:hypothetical protein